VVEAEQRTSGRNINLFTPPNRVQSLVREAVLHLAGWPFAAPLIERLLNREGERLSGPGCHFRPPPNRISTDTPMRPRACTSPSRSSAIQRIHANCRSGRAGTAN
jgi:hypothetical protein